MKGLFKLRSSKLPYSPITMTCSKRSRVKTFLTLGKFDPRSDEAIFLAYALNSKAYRVFSKRTLVIEKSIHIIFYETNGAQRKVVLDDDDDIEKKMEKMSLENKVRDGKSSRDKNEEEPPLKDLQRAEEQHNNLPRSYRFGEFEISIIGELKFFLGLQIKQCEDGIFINQENYTKKMLKKFGGMNMKSIGTPISPSIKLDKDDKGKYVDQKLYRANHLKNESFNIGQASQIGQRIFTAAERHSRCSVATVGFHSCCAQILWIKQNDFGMPIHKVLIYCDNMSAINISKNLVQHPRTKYIEIRHHFIRDHVLKGDVKIEFINTLYQLGDIFTKPLSEDQFCRIRRE
ncbi:Uncharacterized protein TCM_038756 [Theobroma cacao]|uniref:Retroviral polymerase SH3-like domain-containing protein n=1 Tax=Theobroma cacao TaxID=3641 RepID=A0A061GQD3_THECC|nr:Uncharacterized protein TCM_038756 [Theobroma cacao]